MARSWAFAIALLCAVAASTAGVTIASAAGPGQYGTPQFWPLRGQNLIGCSRNSPGAICGGNYHPVWAIDIQGPEGQAVYASGAGLAKVNSNSTGCSGYGRSVVVEHGGSTKSLYGHLSNFSSALSASPGGVWVDQNSVIGYIGHTGSVSNCSYNHLHYEETTNGGFWASATDPGGLKGCIGGAEATYPNHWGAGSWNGLSGHTFTARHDGPGCWGPQYGEGSFVQRAGHPEVYRIAGGAPIYVSTWSIYGGPQPVATLSDPEFAALRSVPANNTFVNSAQDGAVYRFAGGAPIYVSSWSTYGGPQATITIDKWAIDHPTHPLAHMNPVPANNTFINTAQDGRVYRIAGGAPIYVSTWNTYGGPQPTVTVDKWAVDHLAHPAAHMNEVPADNTLIHTAQDGAVYRIAGGAPIYVSTWNTYGGPQPTVAIDKWAVDNVSHPAAHMRSVPTDGTFVHTAQDGAVFRIAGGAPLYVSSWDHVGGPKSYVTIDKWAVDHAANPAAHMRQLPLDGTFIKGHSSDTVFRVTGGAPLPITTWDIFGGTQPTVQIDQIAIDRGGESGLFSHLNWYPVEGTILKSSAGGALHRVEGSAPIPILGTAGLGADAQLTDVETIARAGGSGEWGHLKAPPATRALSCSERGRSLRSLRKTRRSLVRKLKATNSRRRATILRKKIKRVDRKIRSTKRRSCVS